MVTMKSESLLMDRQIVKSNHVIEASYQLTLNEQRLILLCIQQIKKGQGITPEKAFVINASEVASAYNVTTDRAYTLLQEVSDRLYERSLTIYKPDPEFPQKQTKTRWITAIDYLESEGKIYLYFAPKVIPYISMLEGQFTRYNLEYIAPMISVYGVRFYELFKCWLKSDKSKVKSIGLDELKKLLDVRGQYLAIKDFKLKVLNRGLEDVNQHTDLEVTYENKRTGRKITSLEFTIKTKQKTSKLAQSSSSSSIIKASSKVEPNLAASERAEVMRCFTHALSSSKLANQSLEKTVSDKELKRFKEYGLI